MSGHFWKVVSEFPRTGNSRFVNDVIRRNLYSFMETLTQMDAVSEVLINVLLNRDEITLINARNMKEIISLAVDELIAFANTKGGTVYFGVEDKPIEVTGCDRNYDGQRIIEGIYDRTVPPLFTEISDFEYQGKLVIAISVKADGKTYTATDGRCLKRLGRNSKPAYPDELSNVYSSVQNSDFSGRIIGESTLDDVNKLEVYSLKEKLRVRDSKSTLPDLDDIDFLRDLQLIKYDGDVERLTIAGLLFVGKETSIQRLLPQAEVIYLHYSADNLEEYDARLDLKLPLISVIDKLTERVQAYSKIENIQVRLFRLEVEDFPERVFQEALLMRCLIETIRAMQQFM